MPILTWSPSSEAETVAFCRHAAKEWAPLLQALAQEERLVIALLLARAARTEREIERATGMSQQLVSYHLRALREAEAVVVTAEGRSNRYRLCCPELDEMVILLREPESSTGRENGSAAVV